MAAKKKSAKRSATKATTNGEAPAKVAKPRKVTKGKRRAKGGAGAIDRAFKMGRALGRLEGAAG